MADYFKRIAQRATGVIDQQPIRPIIRAYDDFVDQSSDTHDGVASASTTTLNTPHTHKPAPPPIETRPTEQIARPNETWPALEQQADPIQPIGRQSDEVNVDVQISVADFQPLADAEQAKAAEVRRPIVDHDQLKTKQSRNAAASNGVEVTTASEPILQELSPDPVNTVTGSHPKHAPQLSPSTDSVTIVHTNSQAEPSPVPDVQPVFRSDVNIQVDGTGPGYTGVELTTNPPLAPAMEPTRIAEQKIPPPAPDVVIGNLEIEIISENMPKAKRSKGLRKPALRAMRSSRRSASGSGFR